MPFQLLRKRKNLFTNYLDIIHAMLPNIILTCQRHVKKIYFKNWMNVHKNIEFQLDIFSVHFRISQNLCSLRDILCCFNEGDNCNNTLCYNFYIFEIANINFVQCIKIERLNLISYIPNLIKNVFSILFENRRKLNLFLLINTRVRWWK